MSSVRTLRKFAAFSRREQALLVGSAVMLLASRLLLTTVGLPRTLRVLTTVERVLPPFDRTASPATIAWAVTAAARQLPVDLACLEQATVGKTLLVAHDCPVDLRLGVDKSRGEFEAHAWVEQDGTVLIGGLPDLDRFEPFPRTGGLPR